MKWLVFLIVLIGLAAPTMAQEQRNGSERTGSRPYGDYCYSSRWGWYGAKRRVGSVSEAKSLLQDYYADDDVSIGKIVRKQDYFQAEIRDTKNKIIDRVIVDRRTGRIRSIY